MKNKKRLTLCLLVLLLLGSFFLTAYAASYLTRQVKDNYFQTGEIKINLNDGKAIITPEEFLFEPGMTVRKHFFVANEGTGDFYYKVYFTDVQGALADGLEVTIQDAQGNVLWSGILSQLTRQRVKATQQVMSPGERREFAITIHFPEEKGNLYQEKSLHFRLAADAVQTKNNPDRMFD